MIHSATELTAPRRRPLRRGLLWGAIALILVVWLLRPSLQSWIIARGALGSEAPSPELLEEYLQRAPDPDTALLAAWNTGRIVQRQFVIRHLSQSAHGSVSQGSVMEEILLAGTLDADLNVREAALMGLRSLGHPALAVLAAAQLQDPDPEVRLLGLECLKAAVTEQEIAPVADLLDDPEWSVAGRAIKLLEQWSGQDFGVKLADTIPFLNRETGLKEFRVEGLARTRAAAERARAWWAGHYPGAPPVMHALPKSARDGSRPVPTADFRLPALDGRTVRLSDFRGVPVLLNFWTTWCTACLGEVPTLIELQERYGDRLAILGISLDAVPDSHGHIGGHDDHDHDHDSAKPSIAEIRAKVTRMATRLGIDYTVLLDERNRVGARFQGGELPTTVIIDAQGHLRRRFVGARSLSAFEAMLAEVLTPNPSTAATVRR